MCFFSAKAFLISAIVTVKIIYSSFLASYASGVALIIQISKVSSKLKLSLVSYIVSYLGLGLVLGTELVLDLGLGSLSILFIVEYQFFWYFYMLSLSFCLVQGVAVKVSSCGYILFLGSQQILVEISYQWNLVEFGGILRQVELGGLFRYSVNISRNFRLIDPSRFFRFQFRV